MTDHNGIKIGPSACETEPFLSPDAIQPHGFLLTLDPTDAKILQLSANCQALFSLDLALVVGQTWQEVLPGEPMQTLWEMASKAMNTRRSHRVMLSVDAKPQPYWASLHHQEGVLLVEFEACQLDEATLLQDALAAYHLSAELAQLNTAQAIANDLVAQLRAWSGFEQVVLYRFIDGGHGQVVAEDRVAELPSYLGMLFPASDIPYQVRAHACHERIRMMPDLACEAVALLPTHNPRTNRPLNQAQCQLRMPHYWAIEYYRNMGVGAVLAIAMVADGQLLGYVCFHHRQPMLVDHERRRQIDQLVQQATQRMMYQETLDRRNRYHRRRMEAALWSERLMETPQSQWLSSGLAAQAPSLLDADGFAMCSQGQWYCVGDVPKLDSLEQLRAWLLRRDEPMYLDHRLVDDYPQARRILACSAGLAALLLDSEGHSCLLWFRAERQHQVDWAGKPDKALEASSSGEYKPTPRASFARWRETVVGQSTPFDEADQQLLEDLQKSLAGYFRERKHLFGQGVALHHSRLNKLLGSLHDVVWHFSVPDLATTYVSPSVERITGYSPLDFTTDAGLWRQTIDPADHQRVSNLLSNLAVGSTYRLEYCIRHRTGKPYWVEGRGEMIGGVDGQPQRIESILSDITERHQLQEALREARYQAEQASSTKSRFLATMSHEIRTPLNAIVGFSQILAQELGDHDRYQRFLQGLSSGASTLLELLNDILDFSRIEAHQMALRPEPTDIAELLLSIQQLFQLTAETRGLALHVESDPGLPAMVELDRLRLRQVLLNLTGNALKFTQQGSVTVSVSSSATVGQSERVDLRFSVSDTGAGIDPALHEQIFQVFQQGEDDHYHSGSGLGLAISRQLAELMGGSLTLESTLGVGSCFTFALPALPLVAAKATAREVQSDVRFAPATLMVVEDDPASHAAIKRYLLDQPLSVLELPDAEQMLDALATRRPTLILMDLHLPGMSAFEALIRLETHPDWRDIPVVMMTATTIAEVDQAQLRHSVGFLHKPFEANVLFSLLARFLALAGNSLAASSSPSRADVGLSAELLAVLETRFMPSYRELEKHRNLKKITHFSTELAQLAEQYPVAALSDYVTALQASLAVHRIGEIRRLVDYFPRLLEHPEHAEPPDHDSDHDS